MSGRILGRMDNWKTLIGDALQEHGESWADIEASTLTEAQLLQPLTVDCPFTIWTAKRVYFPWEYDGDQWVGSVSRQPDGIPTDLWASST